MNSHPMENQRLQEFVSSIKKLPSVPSLYLELVRELRSPMVSVRKIGEIISKDIGMTAKILQLVNSAYYGISREVTSVERAVALLGLGLVKNLVLVTHVFTQLEPRRIAGLPIAGLWRHSMSCSGLARQIARFEKAPREVVDLASTAGLLHDIGKLVLATNLPNRYQQISSLAQKERLPLFAIEQAELGFSHAEVGGILLTRWQLPKPLVEAVALHHFPEQCPSGEFSALTAVHAANCLEHNLDQTNEGTFQEIDQDYLSRLAVQDHVESWQELMVSAAATPM